MLLNNEWKQDVCFILINFANYFCIYMCIYDYLCIFKYLSINIDKYKHIINTDNKKQK